MVLDGQHPVEILMEHHLLGRMDKYPLIIIPECNYLEPSFLEELKSYAANGGNLLIIGSETAELFKKELGIKSLEQVETGQEFIAASGRIGAIRSPYARVELMPGAEVVSAFYNGSDFRDKGNIIASSVNKVGKGKVTAIYFNAGSAYLEYKSPVLRDYISQHITDMFPGQMVKVAGSHLVHVAVNQLNGKMYVNLVNVAGEHTNQTAIGYDEIPSVKDLTVHINTVNKPTKILLQPEGRELAVDFQKGISKVLVPELPIHSILEVIP
jgi:hypothetical protein